MSTRAALSVLSLFVAGVIALVVLSVNLVGQLYEARVVRPSIPFADAAGMIWRLDGTNWRIVPAEGTRVTGGWFDTTTKKFYFSVSPTYLDWPTDQLRYYQPYSIGVFSGK